MFPNGLDRTNIPDYPEIVWFFPGGDMTLLRTISMIIGTVLLHMSTPAFCLDSAVIHDWNRQDSIGKHSYEAAIRSILEGASSDSLESLRSEFAALEGTADNNSAWERLYIRCAYLRRKARLAPVFAQLKQFIFTKHFDMGGSHYAYTEALSDAYEERRFKPGSALCLFSLGDSLMGDVDTLLGDENGVIRDPDISFDGSRILFAWKKGDRDDDYHLYEMNVKNASVGQLTFGLGHADYEGIYLPDGNILFNSTRCVQFVDCWKVPVSNLFLCDGDGGLIRRISYDQVHTNYPKLLADGRVIYTRWEYNDRGQVYPQPLFVMNPDGTHQTEYYGNNSWFPTSILHARPLGDDGRVMAILAGHHTKQQGKVAIVDPRVGNQENQGVTLVAPIRKTPARKQDKYGQKGDLYQYPFPLNDSLFLISRRQENTRWFSIYLMNLNGERELLVTDPGISCNQAIPLTSRTSPPRLSSTVDYAETTGTFSMQDVYQGPGLDGVEPGTIASLRVVALEYRTGPPDGRLKPKQKGPGGSADVFTPVSRQNGSWDVKKVLGEAEVYEDGSAFFNVPARVPVYFQAVDHNGHVVQTMRSWSTLQPGESFACLGCHESKNEAPPPSSNTQAISAGVADLIPWSDSTQGFSFPEHIQPILDRHCTRCHNATHASLDLRPETYYDESAKRTWHKSYYALTSDDITIWVDAMGPPTMIAPYSTGSSRSRLSDTLESGHNDIAITEEEKRTIYCWIDLGVPYAGSYTEGLSEEARKKYLSTMPKLQAWLAQERKNLDTLSDFSLGSNHDSFRPSRLRPNRRPPETEYFVDLRGRYFRNRPETLTPSPGVYLKGTSREKTRKLIVPQQ